MNERPCERASLRRIAFDQAYPLPLLNRDGGRELQGMLAALCAGRDRGQPRLCVERIFSGENDEGWTKRPLGLPRAVRGIAKEVRQRVWKEQDRLVRPGTTYDQIPFGNID